MIDLSSLLITEHKIHTLNKRISTLNEKGGISKWLNHIRLKKKLEKINDFQFYQIDSYLLLNDESYKEIVAYNYKLLQTEKLQFSIYSNDYSYFGNYSQEMIGSIHPNGYSYSHSVKSNFAFLPFDSMKYPKEMTGKIDYWGRLKMKTTKTGYGFLKTLPKKLFAYVDSKGHLKIDNINYDWEIITHNTIGKLIANHFEYDEAKNEEFQSNKAELVDKIHSYWEDLKIKCANEDK